MASMVMITLIGSVIFGIGAQAGLEFLGLGDVERRQLGHQPVLGQQRRRADVRHWWAFVPSGLCIALVAFALALINYGVDEVTNPRLRSTRRRRRTSRRRRDGRHPGGEPMSTLTSRDDAPVLEVTDLCVEYRGENRTVRAVDRVSFTIGRGEIFGLAGESGCGKSTVANAIMRLLRAPAVITGGSIRFQGRDVLALDAEELRALPVAGGRDGLPVGHELPQPRHDHRRPDRRHLHHPRAACRRSRRAGAGGRAARAGAHRPGTAEGPTRTSCPAACASAWSSPWRSPCGRSC